MVDNVQPRSLSCFRIRKRRHENRNGSTKSEHPRASQHDLGWRARRTTSLLPVAGVVFSLDSPLYRTRLPEKWIFQVSDYPTIRPSDRRASEGRPQDTGIVSP